LIQGKALRIEGGEFEMSEMRTFKCADCQHSWTLPYGTGRPQSCPSCNSLNIHRAESDRGGRGMGRRQRRGCLRTQVKSS
jgi:Zn finger protein HypA/HybF involved in hydrogenase expression